VRWKRFAGSVEKETHKKILEPSTRMVSVDMIVLTEGLGKGRHSGVFD
jgi:hypothetical protein